MGYRAAVAAAANSAALQLGPPRGAWSCCINAFKGKLYNGKQCMQCTGLGYQLNSSSMPAERWSAAAARQAEAQVTSTQTDMPLVTTCCSAAHT